ncbi:MAG: hypothetical protein Kow0092_23720 [Deferrisomatales bacterium]
MICPQCGREGGAERNYCGGCGGRLRRYCERCGFRNDVSDRFCGGCGVALGAAAGAQPRDGPLSQAPASPLPATSPGPGPDAASPPQPAAQLAELLEAAREADEEQGAAGDERISQDEIDALFGG